MARLLSRWPRFTGVASRVASGVLAVLHGVLPSTAGAADALTGGVVETTPSVRADDPLSVTKVVKTRRQHRMGLDPCVRRDPGNAGWSIYGAERAQTGAIRGKHARRENGSNKPKLSPPIADSCAHNAMVKRLFATGCRIPRLDREGVDLLALQRVRVPRTRRPAGLEARL